MSAAQSLPEPAAAPAPARPQAAALPPGTVPMPLSEILAVAREYVDASRYDAAERLLGHILAANPRHGETLHLKGYIAFKRNKGEEAAALMEQGLKAGANQPRQLCNLGEVYRLIGRLDEGLAMTRRAQALAPTDSVA